MANKIAQNFGKARFLLYKIYVPRGKGGKKKEKSEFVSINVSIIIMFWTHVLKNKSNKKTF